MSQNKIILKIGYSCNHRCDFCHAEFNKAITQKETIKTAKKLLYIKQHKKDISTILLSGGEPTIQTNFFTLLELASKLGFTTGIVTNGSMIYKKEFLEKCLAYRFKYIYLSLHGGTPEIHNKMSGAKDSFAQIKSFLEHLQTFSHNLVLSFNCVVTKNNIDHLEAVIAFIKGFGFKKIKFSLLEPKGLGYENIGKLFVSPEKVAKEICILIEKYPDMNIAWDGLPLCLVKGYETHVSNLKTEDIEYMSEIYEDEIFHTDYGVREYAPKCETCSQKNNCYGNFALYNELYGDDYLKTQ